MNILKGPWFLKVFSLVTAVSAYWYITNEIRISEKKNANDPSYQLIKLTTKSLKINVRLETAAPEGYRVLENQVSTKPQQVIVIGPSALLERAVSAETAIVDISESTKTITKKIPLESVAGIPLTGEPYLVDVTVPIEAVEKPS